MVLGLVGAIILSSGSILKAICMIPVGLLLGLVGTDVNSGMMRYTFNIPALFDGIDFVCVAMGLFGFAEVITNLSHKDKRETFTKNVSGLWPTWIDFKRMMPAILRGTTLGSILGILPGGGAVLSSFASYTLEKKVSKYSAEFGKGAIEGVAGPESANNAAAQTSFIPLLTMGIPSNAVMALMVGAMTIHNIQAGSAGHAEQPGTVLGADCFDVGRQPDAGDSQPADAWRLGETADHPLSLPVPGDPRVLLHRRVFAEQQRRQHLHHRHPLGIRLRALEVRLRGPRRCCLDSCSGR